MKITVTVDLEDLFVEGEETTITEEVKSAIMAKIKQEAIGNLSKQSLEVISHQIKEELAASIPTIVTSRISEVISNNKIRKASYNEDLITIQEYIEKEISNKYATSSDIDRYLHSVVNQQAKDIAEELKTRYDANFALQIVNNMKNMGMLKDDVSQMLLPNT